MAAPVVAFCLTQPSSAVPALLVPNVLFVMNKHLFYGGRNCLLIQHTPVLPQVNVLE